jgi:hypothetical protein
MGMLRSSDPNRSTCHGYILWVTVDLAFNGFPKQPGSMDWNARMQPSRNLHMVTLLSSDPLAQSCDLMHHPIPDLICSLREIESVVTDSITLQAVHHLATSFCTYHFALIRPLSLKVGSIPTPLNEVYFI